MNTERDSAAFEAYKAKADNGDAQAQNDLGVCYRIGRGVAKDDDLAAHWFRKAASQGCADGQNNLGTCYFYGWGPAKDEELATYWYRKAAEQWRVMAEQGDAKAQYKLGD